MDGLGFEVEFDAASLATVAGLSLLGESFAAAGERALDVSAAAILNRLRTGFLQELDPWGQKWVPSKAGERRKSRGQGQTLFKTGRLFRSIQLSKATTGERQISSDVPYGPFLQDNPQVPRVFLSFTDEHLELASAIYLNEIKKVLL